MTYDQGDDDSPNYSKWNITLEASVSKKHVKDGFYPLEVISPIITADNDWATVVGHIWSTMQSHFEFRRDTSCGFHIHISFATGSYSLEQLRSMAKAVLGFCKGAMKDNSRLVEYFTTGGPLRGLRGAFDYIDQTGRDEIVDFVCPDKYRAWNSRPSRIGGHGSIEFRRPPGVVTAKKAKHWMAFAMTFMVMAIQFNPEILADNIDSTLNLDVAHPDVQDRFLSQGLGGL